VTSVFFGRCSAGVFPARMFDVSVRVVGGGSAKHSRDGKQVPLRVENVVDGVSVHVVVDVE